jgi:NADH:ubiquinone reductase (H+-translocating)
MQSGLYAGRRLRRELDGRGPSRPFRYYDLGSAAYISLGNAVVSASPIRLSGFAGWLAWLFIHIGFLTGYRNRVAAVLTWCVAFTLDLRRERAFTMTAIRSRREFYEPTSGQAADEPAAAQAAETWAPAPQA